MIDFSRPATLINDYYAWRYTSKGWILRDDRLRDALVRNCEILNDIRLDVDNDALDQIRDVRVSRD